MLLILGAIGMGAVLGWSLSNSRLAGRNLLLSLIALAAAAIEIKAICPAASILPVSAAMAVAFGLRVLVLNLLRARAAARS